MIKMRKKIVENISKKYPDIHKMLIDVVAGEFFFELSRRIKAGKDTRVGNFFFLKYINKNEKFIYKYKLIRPAFIEPKFIFNYKFKKYANEKIKQNIKNHMEKYGTEF